MSQNHSNPSVALELARAYQQKARSEDALAILQSVSPEMENSGAFHFQLAQVYAVLPRPADAQVRNAFTELEANSQRFCTLMALAHTCISPTRVFALLLCWTAICNADAQPPAPKCDEAVIFQRADQLVRNRQYDDASDLLKRFEACPGRKPMDPFELGWLYGRARRFEDALKLFEAVPHDVPDTTTDDYAIALSKFELGNYQGAIDVLRPSQASGKADDKSLNLLVVSYSKLGLYRMHTICFPTRYIATRPILLCI